MKKSVCHFARHGLTTLALLTSVVGASGGPAAPGIHDGLLPRAARDTGSA